MLEEQLCLLDNSENVSSHDTIVAKMNIQKYEEPKIEKDFSSTYTEFKKRKPIWKPNKIEKYQDETFQKLKSYLNDMNSPEYIPYLSEMAARTLVKTAEKYFVSVVPSKTKKKRTIHFFEEYKKAHIEHKRVCQQWRMEGRPNDQIHPAERAKIISQRNLQQKVRREESEKAKKQHEDLMETHSEDFSKVCSKLKTIRGDKKQANISIPFINTLCGSFSGKNVLEGFRAKTEALCNQKSNNCLDQNTFYQMCVEDNNIIYQLTCH